jgi:hypothetical protein
LTPRSGAWARSISPRRRVAYNFSESWALAIEHYADYGKLNAIEPLNRQQQSLFAVVDYKADPLSVEFGIGHGFTAASDALVLKLILSHDFQAPDCKSSFPRKRLGKACLRGAAGDQAISTRRATQALRLLRFAGNDCVWFHALRVGSAGGELSGKFAR